MPAPSADTSVAAGHINFFADLERQLEADGTARNPAKDAQNPEYQVRPLLLHVLMAAGAPRVW